MMPGIYYDLPMQDYVDLPAVNAGALKTLLDECPRAAWHGSAFNPDREREDTAATDAGSIAHAIFLEGDESGVQEFHPCDYLNADKKGFATGWSNKAIRDARDECRAAGRIPILASDMAEIRGMVAAAWSFVDSLVDTEPAVWQMFQPDGGESEVTFVWEESGTLCKARTDRIRTDFRVVADYKSSAMSVAPDRWARTQLVGQGYYISAAWYRRGILALTGVEPDYLFLCGELAAPHLHSLIGLDPAGLALGAEKCDAALRMWQRCAATGAWPAYPARACYPELPVYERARWDERNGVDEHGIPYDLTALWGKPKEHPFTSKRDAA